MERVTLKELINEKDYDYISFRFLYPKDDKLYTKDGEYWGCCKSKNGKLIPLDGDSYDNDIELARWEEWSDPQRGIVNGLTIWEQYPSDWFIRG